MYIPIAYYFQARLFAKNIGENVITTFGHVVYLWQLFPTVKIFLVNGEKAKVI